MAMEKNQKKLSKAINDYFQQNKNLGRSYQKQNIEEIWSDVVGPMITNYTQSVKIEFSTVKVKVSSAPLKQELQFLKSELILKINERLPYEKVEELLIF